MTLCPPIDPEIRTRLLALYNGNPKQLKRLAAYLARLPEYKKHHSKSSAHQVLGDARTALLKVIGSEEQGTVRYAREAIAKTVEWAEQPKVQARASYVPPAARVAQASATSAPTKPSALALVPVHFHKHTLEAAKDNQTVWVSVKRVCEALGDRRLYPSSKAQRVGWAGTA